MLRSTRSVALALALVSGSFVPSVAMADEPTKELRVPSAPTQDDVDSLAVVTKAMSPEMLASFRAVAADAQARLRASRRAAANGEGEALTVDKAARAALVAADFGGLGKKKSKVLDAVVAFTSLQIVVDMHDALRDRTGRQLAIRAVRACKGKVACLDGIAPTTDMTAKHIADVRKDLDGKGKDLEAEDRLGNFEIQDLMSAYNEGVVGRVKTSDKMQKAMLDFIKG